MPLDHPLHVDATGRTATARGDRHVRNLIQQVLFTAPGERVNRPDFGCGLLRLVHHPNSDVLVTATRFLVQGSLQRWLGDLIEVREVRIRNDGERLVVDVVYIRLDTGDACRDRFTREVA